MKLVIARNRKGSFEAHVKGCRDAMDQQKYDPEESMFLDASTVQEIVTFIYPPGDFCYDENVPEQYSQYRNDVRVMPCCGTLPETEK